MPRDLLEECGTLWRHVLVCAPLIAFEQHGLTFSTDNFVATVRTGHVTYE